MTKPKKKNGENRRLPQKQIRTLQLYAVLQSSHCLQENCKTNCSARRTQILCAPRANMLFLNTTKWKGDEIVWSSLSVPFNVQNTTPSSPPGAPNICTGTSYLLSSGVEHAQRRAFVVPLGRDCYALPEIPPLPA